MSDEELYNKINNLEELFVELEESRVWKDIVMKNYGLNELQFKNAIKLFKTKCMVSCESHSINSLRKYFASWFPGNKETIIKVTSGPKRI